MKSTYVTVGFEQVHWH